MYSNAPGLTFPSLTPAIRRLLIINAVVFGVVAVSLAFDHGFMVKLLGLSGEGMLEWYGLGVLRVLTYQFTHDPFGLWHILFNMLVLYFFGTMAEHRIGYRGVFKLYLVGGAAGGMLHVLLSLVFGQPGMLVIGASGACYAFLLYAATMAPRSIVILLFIPVPLGLLAGFMVLVGVYMTWLELIGVGGDGVSHGAHLGGALIGFLACRRDWFRDHVPYAYNPGLLGGLRDKLEKIKAERVRKRRAEHQRILDAVLDKVHKHGITALTPEERKFLDRASREMKDD